MRKILIIIASFFFLASCDSGTDSLNTASIKTIANGINLDSLDGAVDVPVNASFFKVFTQDIDESTVTTSTFFIVPTPNANIATPLKAIFNESVCNVNNALPADVTCLSAIQCVLDPTNDLSYGTGYTVCLTAGVMYANTDNSIFIRSANAAAPIDGESHSFTTERSPIQSITISPTTATVAKDSIQQFTASDQDNNDISSSVTWAVTGGDSNGTTSAAGLYTPPSTIPLDENVTVTATSGSVSGSSDVTITVGDALTFTEKIVIGSDYSIFPSALSTAVDDVNNIIYVIWGDLYLDTLATNVYLSKSVDGGATFTNSDNLKAVGDVTFFPGLILSSSGDLVAAYFYFPPSAGMGSKSFRSQDQGGSFSTPTATIVKPESTDNGFRIADMAADSTDAVYASIFTVMSDADDADKYEKAHLEKSTDLGLTFTYIGVVDSHYGLFASGDDDPSWCINDPATAIDPDDKVYIAYGKINNNDCGGDGGGRNNLGSVYLKTYDETSGISATPVRINSDASGSNMNPDIETDSQGVVHAVWLHQDAFSTGDATIYYARSTDGGASFSTQTAIASPGDLTFSLFDMTSEYYFPVIDIDPMDNINAAYYTWNGSNLDIYLTRSRDGGDTWDTPVKANSSSCTKSLNPPSAPNLAPILGIDTDSAGRVYISAGFDADGDDLWELIFAVGE